MPKTRIDWIREEKILGALAVSALTVSEVDSV